jgi:hypothetical protein
MPGPVFLALHRAGDLPVTTLRLRTAVALSLLCLFLTPTALPRAAAAPPAGGTVAASSASKYWQGFVDFWSGAVKRQSGVVLIALGVGVVSLFIITRAKWRKG